MNNKKLKNRFKIIFTVIVLLLLIKTTTPAKTVSGTAPFTVNFIGDAISTNPVASYHWDFGDGETSPEQNPTHIYNNAGTYYAVLTVTDDQGKIATDTVVVIVSAANAPPIANAGQDKSSAVSTITQLDGSLSYDPEQKALTYNWAQIQTSALFVTLSSTTAQKPSFTATQEGTYEFQLTVYDGELYSQPDTVNITINPNPPEITNIQVAPVASSSGTMFEITATVVDNTQSGVDVAVDINSPGLADDLVLSNQGGNEYMTVWDSANAPSGVHTAEATATSNNPVLTDTASEPFSIEETAAECAVASSCAADQTCIFSMNAETNSHASQSCDAAYKVCCSSSKFTSNSCGTTILKINAASNAHAAEPSTTIADYSTNICVSPSTIQCSNRDGNCNSDETCVASIAQATASPVYNTHVARCDFYSLKICCKGQTTSQVTCSSSSIIGDANGDQSITLGDANSIYDIVLGIIPAPSNTCCVDVDNDGSVTSRDALFVFNHYLGISDPLDGGATGTTRNDCLVGDANGDGSIDISDAELIFDAYLNAAAEDFCHIDVNDDQDITPGDALLVYNYALGIAQDSIELQCS